jgi:hypothetical protein
MATRRYDEGGYAESEDSKYDMPAPSSSMAEATELAAEKKQTFKEAFAAARRSGAKTFEYKGKKYTTELAGSASARKSAPAYERKEYAAVKPKVGETPYDTMNRRNRADEDAKAEIRSEANRLARRMGTGKHASGKPILAPEGYAKGGMTASRRGDGCAQRGKTRGKMV